MANSQTALASLAPGEPVYLTFELKIYVPVKQSLSVPITNGATESYPAADEDYDQPAGKVTGYKALPPGPDAVYGRGRGARNAFESL